MKPENRHVLGWFGLALGLPLSAFVLNAVFFRPPPRPAAVPADALPFKHYEADSSSWWWASCRDLGKATYSCRLYDERSALAVAGRFTVQPRSYTDDGVEHAGQCRPDAAKRRFLQYSNGEIYAQPGCMLVPRDWTYFPSRRMKAAVTLEGGRASLAREVPMSADELTGAAQ